MEYDLYEQTINWKMKVLIAEDDLGIRTMIETCLQRWNIQFTATANAEQAITVFLADPLSFDCVLTDLHMSNDSLAGKRVVKAVKNRRPDLKVIVISGSLTPEIISSAGADAYIQKPFNPMKLKEALPH